MKQNLKLRREAAKRGAAEEEEDQHAHEQEESKGLARAVSTNN